MRIAQVHINVRPECLEAFKDACAENAAHSIQEDGIARFDILQSDDEPTTFVLLEVYRSAAAQAAHKETAHFAKWRDEVKNLIVAPGHAVIYSTIFPGDDSWT